MTRVLLNCTTLVIGGALQAAVSFIRTANAMQDDIDWYFALSQVVYEELKKDGVLLPSDKTWIINPTPARDFWSRKKLKKLESEVNPDVVFTFFGPAYVKFGAPHLCGVADAWVTHSDKLAFKTLQGVYNKLKRVLLILYKSYWYRKADAWVTETLAAKEGLVRRLRLDGDKIQIVPNNCGKRYLESDQIASVLDEGETLRVMCLSAYYPHKNLGIIPFVAREIASLDPSRRFEFVLTLPDNSAGWQAILDLAERLGVRDFIKNIGPVAVADGPSLYKKSHILFLPSVLENFSANYPEAMAMGRPIVTSDLGFARDVCKTAALYFEPMNAKAAAQAIVALCWNAELWQSLITEGKRVLRAIPTHDMKYEMYKHGICTLHRRGMGQGGIVPRSNYGE